MMIKLKGKKGECLGMEFELADHGWDLSLQFECDFTAHSKLTQHFQTFAYRKPRIEELFSLTKGNHVSAFEFDALQFGMAIQRCQLGIYEEYVVKAHFSTVAEIDLFPWPTDELDWIIFGKKPLAKLDLAFSIGETELIGFYSSLKHFFELISGP